MNGRRAAEAAGITYRQLDHWTSRGYLDTEGSETLRRAVGSGRDRAYSDADVERLRVMGELCNGALEVPPAAAAKVAEAVVLRGRTLLTVGRWALVRDWTKAPQP